MTFKNLLSNLMTKILICVIAFLVVFYIVLIKAQKPSPPNHGVLVRKTITDRASSERTASTDVKKLDKMSKAIEDVNKDNEFVSINSLIPKEIISYEYSLSKDLMLSGAAKHGQGIEPLTPGLSKKDLQASLEKENVYQRLIAIKPISLKDGCEIEILSDSPIHRFDHFFLYSPPRLVINLFGKWRPPRDSEIKLESDLLKGIRLGLHRDKLRIVFDLEKDEYMKPIIRESSRGLIVIIRPIA